MPNTHYSTCCIQTEFWMRALRVKLTKDSQLCMTIYILSLVKYFYPCLQVCGKWRNQDNNMKTITLQVCTNVNNLSSIFRFTMNSSTDDVHWSYTCEKAEGAVSFDSLHKNGPMAQDTLHILSRSEGCLRCGGGCLYSEPTQVTCVSTQLSSPTNTLLWFLCTHTQHTASCHQWSKHRWGHHPEVDNSQLEQGHSTLHHQKEGQFQDGFNS